MYLSKCKGILPTSGIVSWFLPECLLKCWLLSFFFLRQYTQCESVLVKKCFQFKHEKESLKTNHLPLQKVMYWFGFHMYATKRYCFPLVRCWLNFMSRRKEEVKIAPAVPKDSSAPKPTPLQFFGGLLFLIHTFLLPNAAQVHDTRLCAPGQASVHFCWCLYSCFMC